jgi:hypothetical protein
MSYDEELETFKTQIELPQYAASLGFEYEKGKSSRRSAVMSLGEDKVIIKLDASDGHYVYFMVHDDDDNGSIIDFAARRKRLNLGQVRKELRPGIGRPAPADAAEIEKSSKDRGAVQAEFEGMTDAESHSYLETVRRIPAALLSSLRFHGSVRVDKRGNAVFGHFDQEGP